LTAHRRCAAKPFAAVRITLSARWLRWRSQSALPGERGRRTSHLEVAADGGALPKNLTATTSVGWTPAFLRRSQLHTSHGQRIRATAFTCAAESAIRREACADAELGSLDQQFAWSRTARRCLRPPSFGSPLWAIDASGRASHHYGEVELQRRRLEGSTPQQLSYPAIFIRSVQRASRRN